ncbi:hypothetical protein BS78_04G071000 [Paspalum vaginatum]|nr:hypothetical protein BS78_04G071000 [Paspalum vaginatum]
MVSQREMARLEAERAPPAWLRQLLETEFFEPCPRHPTSASRATATRTAGCNFFCTHFTGGALCSGCLGDHEGHQLVQIRRSSGHCVVKVADVEHLLNVSLVQTYRINGANAVFLNCRPMLGHGWPGASRCEKCERGLQDATSCFCSLGCKPNESDDDDDDENEDDNDDGDDNDGDEDDDDDDDGDDVDDDSDDDDDLNDDSDDDDGDDDRR